MKNEPAGPWGNRKTLWLDIKTTGANPITHDPIQITGIIEANGTLNGFDFRVRPTRGAGVSSETLEINGVTMEEIRDSPPPEAIHRKLVSLLGKTADRHNKTDKFILAGRNVQFNSDIMNQWFKKLGDKYWLSWVKSIYLDTERYAVLLQATINVGLDIFLEEHQDETVPAARPDAIWEAGGMDIGETGDPMYDIKATRRLAIWQAKRVKEISDIWQAKRMKEALNGKT